MNILFYLKNPIEIFFKIIKTLNRKAIDRFNDEIEKIYPELKKVVEQALNKYHSGGGFHYESRIQKFKLYSLFKLLKKFNPASILELGSGSTTAILNYYAQHNKANVLVLEESNQWKDNTEKILSQTGGQSENLTIMLCTRKIIQSKPFGVTCYDYDYSTVSFDLVIVDGPSTEIDGVFKHENYNSDLLNIYSLYYPKAVIIDNRKSTYLNFKAIASTDYTFIDTCIWTLNSQLHGKELINFYSYAQRK